MAPDLLSKILDELDARLGELRPLVAEYEQLLHAAEGLATEGGARRGAATKPKRTAPKARSSTVKSSRPRAVRGAAREAILAALEHGSHTVAELAVVTAMSAPNISGNLRKLAAEGKITKTEREGKAAWALVAG